MNKKVMKQALNALEVARHPRTDESDALCYSAIKALCEVLRQPARTDAKPFAYAVYFPNQPNPKLVPYLDYLLDDAAPVESNVIPLYTQNQLTHPIQTPLIMTAKAVLDRWDGSRWPLAAASSLAVAMNDLRIQLQKLEDYGF